MDITITFQDGRWKTDPDPAIVLRGTPLRWVVRGPRSEITRLRWIINFRKQSPFLYGDGRLIVVTTNTGLGRARIPISDEIARSLDQLGVTEEVLVDHRGSTPPVTAEAPGDYKYDLHLENDETGEQIGDEDPRLYVIDEIWRYR